MKQRVVFQRTEILKLELEVVQPLSRETLERLMNEPGKLGSPMAGALLAQEISFYELKKAEPSCECSGGEGGRKTSRRKK